MGGRGRTDDGAAARGEEGKKAGREGGREQKWLLGYGAVPLHRRRNDSEEEEEVTMAWKRRTDGRTGREIGGGGSNNADRDTTAAATYEHRGRRRRRCQAGFLAGMSLASFGPLDFETSSVGAGPTQRPAGAGGGGRSVDWSCKSWPPPRTLEPPRAPREHRVSVCRPSSSPLPPSVTPSHSIGGGRRHRATSQKKLMNAVSARR